MQDSAAVEIPNRALFKAAEVCELMKVQPYVLRSWEAEFPDLGVAKTPGSPRIYRRADVERVARIKHLLLVDGLTLAGARRKLEEESAPVAADVPAIDELIGQHARERLTEVKRGLQSLLDLLEGSGSVAEFRLQPPVAAARGTHAARHRVEREPARPKAGKPAAKEKPQGRHGAAARRKRSA